MAISPSTEKLITERDRTFDRWAADCLELASRQAFLNRKDVYLYMVAWAGAVHRDLPGKQTCLQQITQRIGKPIRRNGLVGWRGLRLVDVGVAAMRDVSRFALHDEQFLQWARVCTGREKGDSIPGASSESVRGPTSAENIASLWVETEGLALLDMRQPYEAIRAARRGLLELYGVPDRRGQWDLCRHVPTTTWVEVAARAAAARLDAVQAVGRWLGETCRPNHDRQAHLVTLWESYCGWVEQQAGQRPTDGAARMKFRQQLELALGAPVESGGRMSWIGVELIGEENRADPSSLLQAEWLQ